MFAYGKALIRLVVLFALVVAAIVLSKPATVAAYQDCCQTCEDRYNACLSGCTTSFCRLGCQKQFSFCIEICPACQ